MTYLSPTRGSTAPSRPPAAARDASAASDDTVEASPLLPAALEAPAADFAEILRILGEAKEKIREMSQRSDSEGEKKAKLEALLKRIEEAERRIALLSRQSPAALKGTREEMLRAAVALLEEVNEREYMGVETAGGHIQRIETSLSSVDYQRNTGVDGELMVIMFGPNWQEGFSHQDLWADGVIMADELSPLGEQWFEGLGPLAKDGLSPAELEKLVRAKKEFFALLGLRLTEDTVRSRKAEEAFKALLALAAEGKLDCEQANKILKTFAFGIRLTQKAFSYLFVGSKDGKVVKNIEQLLDRIHNIFRTMKLASGVERIDFNEMTAEETKALNGAFQDYSRGENFFFVRFDQQGEQLARALRERYGLSEDATREDILNYLFNLDSEFNLRSVFESIYAEDLSIAEKWDLLTLAVLRELYENRLQGDGSIKEPERRTADRRHRFKDLMEAVQAPETTADMRAYRASLAAVLIEGSAVNAENITEPPTISVGRSSE